MAKKEEASVEEEVPAEEEASAEEKTPPKKESKAEEGTKYDGGPIPRR